MSGSVIAGILFWLCLIVFLVLVRPGARIHQTRCDSLKKKHFVLILLAMAVWIAAMAKGMSMPSYWNGEIAGHRNQYEVITESFLNGHLYFDYDNIDPKLLEMENPYDKEARDEAHVEYYWDHAFYNGHYYMYFGVVPVLLLFLPFRVLTGHALLTVHATQFFAAGFTVGIFALFWNLTKRFFRNLPLSLYLALSLILSFTCLRYTVKFPALYHTAIAAGLCLMIWSMVCFMKAVWLTEREGAALLLAFAGSLLGALVFGCRPTLAIGNLAVLPLLMIFLKGRKLTPGLLLRLAGAALPYVLIAALLMAYNRARFGDPFEFGQSYQLTFADQSHYGNLLQRLDPAAILNGLLFSFVQSPTLSETAPWLSHGGVLWECPILLLGFSGLLDQKTKKQIRENRLTWFLITLVLTAVLIVILQTVWSPFLLNRYCEDFLWLLAILVFIVAGFRTRTAKKSSIYAGFVCWVSTLSLFIGLLIILIPEEASLTVTRPEFLDQISRLLTLSPAS